MHACGSCKQILKESQHGLAEFLGFRKDGVVGEASACIGTSMCVCAYVCAKCEILACLLQRVTCRLHPVQNFAEDARSAAFAVAVHGDEGKGKRERAVLVISWSCLGVRSSDVLHYKFPYVAARFE